MSNPAKTLIACLCVALIVSIGIAVNIANRAADVKYQLQQVHLDELHTYEGRTVQSITIKGDDVITVIFTDQSHIVFSTDGSILYTSLQ